MARPVQLFLAIGAAGLLLAPTAEAKFRFSISTEPSRPIARSATRVLIRTDIDLPREHGIRLTAVGPWRRNFGQAVFEIRLVWAASRTLIGVVRFPYPGRWHLDARPIDASPFALLSVRVRPRR